MRWGCRRIFHCCVNSFSGRNTRGRPQENGCRFRSRQASRLVVWLVGWDVHRRATGDGEDVLGRTAIWMTSCGTVTDGPGDSTISAHRGYIIRLIGAFGTRDFFNMETIDYNNCPCVSVVGSRNCHVPAVQ
jgi:hypothetical protein